jgi:DNA-binding MarR family transcriptional regulator
MKPDLEGNELIRLAEVPTDEQILAAIRRWGNRSMTYVVRNVLWTDGFRTETPWVLRQLKRLEKAGLVERASSSYAVQLCWSAKEPA